jgi:OFA family oxalate/formate antiporter-like MFS transporter
VASSYTGAARNRWLYLTLAVLAMICIANFQYGWTLFVDPMSTANGWKKAAIQQTFFFFVLAQTWIVPFNGWFADRFGPKPMVALAGVLVAVGWVIDAHAATTNALLAGEVINGLGTGLVYGTMVGLAVKWFPDRRGLAVGLTAAGFGAGIALTVLPIAAMIKSTGYQSAFQMFGIIQGAIIFVIAFFLAYPGVGEVPVVAVGNIAGTRQRKQSYTPAQMIRSGPFWLLYVMMTMIATGLLFLTANIAPMAKDYGPAVLAVVQLTVLIDGLSNGGSRILFGGLSDRLGRELTMTIAFTCQALGLIGLIFAANNPPLFMVCAALTFLASGEIYSLFPASCTDIFGPKFAATNSGILYTAKGTAAAFGVWLASVIYQQTGSWSVILGVLVAFNIIVAALAVTVLKPMRERAVADEVVSADAVGGRTAGAH